ncbi:MAG TPA: hypothetical protein VEF04_07440 [Blastocatellia bacterium]|nr:hypothetical protein [Blastocatellia bacterium]
MSSAKMRASEQLSKGRLTEVTLGGPGLTSLNNPTKTTTSVTERLNFRLE